MSDPCKGFWNMCGCPQCREADRNLEKSLEDASPEYRRALINATFAELLRQHKAKNAKGHNS